MAKNDWGDEVVAVENPADWGDKPAAQQDLPAGVKPSLAGAGRGFMVPPPAAQPATQQGFQPDTNAAEYGDVANGLANAPAQRPVSLLQTEGMTAPDPARRLSMGAGPINQQTAARAETMVDGQDPGMENRPVVERAAAGLQQQVDAGQRDTFGSKVERIQQRPTEELATQRAAEEWRSVGEWASDTGAALVSGAVSLAQLPVNIIAPGSALHESLEKSQQNLQDFESEPMKARRQQLADRVNNEEGFIDQYTATVAELVSNPSVAIHETMRQAAMFAGVLTAARGGAAAAQGGVALASRASPAVTLSEAISGGAMAARAGAAGATAGGVAASSTMAAGDAAGNAYEKLMSEPPEMWEQSEDYQNLIAKGVDPESAKQEIATAKARTAAIIAAPLGLLGFLGAEASFVARGAGRAGGQPLRTVATEMVTEPAEEALTQVAGNYAAQTVDPSQELGEGAGEAAGMATVTSGPFAAAAGINEMRRPVDRTEQIKALRSSGDTTAADMLKRRFDREMATFNAGTESQRLADFGPQVQQRYQEIRMTGVQPGDAVVKTAIRTGFEQAAQMAGLSPKAKAALDAKLETVPADRAPAVVQKYITALADAGAAQPFDGLDTLATDMESQMNSMLDAVIAGDIAPTMEGQTSEGDQTTATEADSAGAGETAVVEDAASGEQAALAELNDVVVTPEMDAVSGSTRIGPDTTQVIGDALPADAQLFGDEVKAIAIREQGFRSLDINDQSMVQRNVVASLHDDKILRSVIERVPVDVVNVLIGSDRSSKDLLSNPTVLFDRLLPPFDDPIHAASVGRFIDAIAAGHPDSLARLAAKEKPTLRVSEPVGSDGEGQSTGGARDVGSHSENYAPSDATKKPLGKINQPANVQDAPQGTARAEAQAAPAETPAAAGGDVAATAGVPAEGGAGDGQADGLSARLGRNNIPVSEGGKPFTTKRAADAAKKLNPGMRVVREGKGYLPAPKTPAQIAAQEKAAKRLGGVGGRGKPMAAHEHLASRGGLSKQTMADLGFDQNQRVGAKWLFASTGGMSLERATESLQQAGYLQGTDQGEAIAMIQRSARGNPVYTPEGFEQMAQAETEAQFEDYLAGQQEQEGFDPFADLTGAGYTEADMEGTGFDDAGPEVQAEVAALASQLEAIGRDPVDIMERLALQYPDDTQKEFHERAKAALTQAIAEATQPSGRGDSGQDGSKQGQAREGSSESLTDRPDGTLAVKGDTKALRERLTAAGIPAKSILPSATGVVVGKTQAKAAREALQPVLTTPTRSDIEAQQDRAEQADKLDERAQVKRESEAGAGAFELTREDGRDGGTQPMFARSATADADGSNLPDAIIGHGLGVLNKHPDYNAAKAGDTDAAIKVAFDLVTPDLVDKVRSAIGSSKPMVVPVVSIEASGRNKIPRAAAEVLAQRLGLESVDGIVQANSPKRTNMDGLDRIFAAPEFDGPVVAGRDYLLLDDTLTQGATFAALASHIQRGGGGVVGSVALTGKQYSAKLQPSAETLEALREKHGDLESEFKAATGYGFDALTESEARYLANFKPPQSVRDRILEEGRRAGEREDQGASQDAVGGDRGDPTNPDTKFAVDDAGQDGDTPSDGNTRFTITDAQRQTVGRVQASIRKRTGNGAYVLEPVELVSGREFIFATDLAREGFGLKITPVRQTGKKVFNGAQVGNDLLMDVNTARPAMVVMGHELLHKLRRDDPVLYSFLKVQIETVLNDGAASGYAKTLRERYAKLKLEALSDDVAFEEMLADIVGDQFGQRKFWDLLATKNQGRMLQLARKVMEFFDRVLGLGRSEFPFGTDRYLKDVTKAREIVADVIAEYSADRKAQADADGVKFSIASPAAKAPTPSPVTAAPATPAQFPLPVTQGNQPPRAPVPVETRARAAQRVVQDQFNRFTVIRNWAKEQGMNLSQISDVWGFEERMHGRIATRIEDFREKRVQPLIQRIQKAGFNMGQVAEYLHAQHAEERNKQILSIDPTNPDGSGMATADAKVILAAAKPELAALANEFRQIADDTKGILLAGGIISQDMVDAWDKTYKHYVPLKGGDEVGQPVGTGKGLSVKATNKRALGHGERAEFIVENMLRDHERAIMLVEKNRVGHSLLAMTVELGRDDIATFGKPERRKVLKNATSFEVVGRNGAVVGTFDTQNDANLFIVSQKRAGLTVRQVKGDPVVSYMASPMLAENEVQVYVKGQTVRIQLIDPLLARGYKKLGIEHLGRVMQVNREINGFLSKAYTAYNPEFFIKNVLRDFTTGLINITGQEGALIAAKAAAHYPKAFGQMLRYSFSGGKKASASIRAYREHGGTTGAAYLSDIERVGADIQAAYEKYQGALEMVRQGKPLKAANVAGAKLVRLLIGFMEHLNAAGENAMRLAVFDAVRNEPGRTIQEAASLAKNSTVNFNRKGEMGALANALYLFFNAAMQGAAATLDALLMAKHKHQAQAVAGALGLLAYSLASMQYGGDDDEDREAWDKIPDHIKDRNLVIRTGEDTHVTLAVPYGYGFFFTLGNAVFDLQRGADLDKIALKLADGLVEHFGPAINPLSGDELDPRGFVELVPGLVGGELMRAGGRVIVNRSGLGGEIVPDSPFDEGKPDNLKMYRSSKGTGYEAAANMMSQITGGTKSQPGAIDVSPETLKFWTQTITGGAGKFIMDTANTVTLMGAMVGEGDPEAKAALTPELREMPLVRTVVRKQDIRDTRRVYWDKVKEAEEAQKSFNRANKMMDNEAIVSLAAQERHLLLLGERIQKSKEAVKALRDAVESTNLSENYTRAEKRMIVKNLERGEEDAYNEMIRAFEAMEPD